jgi:peroxiredoxin
MGTIRLPTGVTMAFAWQIAVTILSGALTFSEAHATELGERAPKFELTGWYNGAPVQIADTSNICVITFFESWCSSCMAALPQLNLCYERFKNQGVKFAGISVEPAETVKTFAEEQAKLKMLSFPVGADKDHVTYDAYMKAFARTSVPNSFVISKGSILWEGPPLAGLEQVLEQIISHTYDIARARKVSGAHQLEDAYFVSAEDEEPFTLLSGTTNKLSVKELGARIVTDGAANPWFLNSFAWKILTDPKIKKRDLELAAKASKMACDTDPTRNPAFIDTYARALFMQAKMPEAIAAQKHAVETASDPGHRARLEKTLKDYEEAAKPIPR